MCVWRGGIASPNTKFQSHNTIVTLLWRRQMFKSGDGVLCGAFDMPLSSVFHLKENIVDAETTPVEHRVVSSRSQSTPPTHTWARAGVQVSMSGVSPLCTSQ